MPFNMPMPSTSFQRLAARAGQIRRAILACCLLAAAATSGGSESLRWFDAGKPTPAALAAVALLQDAASEGLDPTHYAAAELQQAIGNNTYTTEDLASALTQSLQRFLLDVNRGRIDPVTIGEHFPGSIADRLDLEQLLRQAVAAGQVAAAVAAARPRDAQYAALRRALADYRALETDPTWDIPLPPLPGRKLEPGQAWPGVSRLLQRLESLGDLPAGAVHPARYEGAAVAAIQAFQQRHGLTPDGVIGKATMTALEIAPASRVRQIELALERLRWTPHPERGVIVNVPEFMLRAYDSRAGHNTELVAMKVIVGNAARTPTPIFAAAMRYIEFSPYWNVPPSIARSETLPKLRRHPAYFAEQGFEFVAADGRISGQLSEANLDAVSSGQMRIRQRPGARNALGDIKFVFPNPDNIYLHHTPSPQLFKRDRRDFSHGCIRVEQPVELAKFVLADQATWREETIVEAMRGGKSTTLQLSAPLAVVIAYRTAAVIDGKVYFFPDIYGHDARLEQALAARRPVD